MMPEIPGEVGTLEWAEAYRDRKKEQMRQYRRREKERHRERKQEERQGRYWEPYLRFMRGEEVLWEPQHRDGEHPLGACPAGGNPEGECQCPQPYLARHWEIEEALYGGAAGGGKSDFLLAEGARYIHHPLYRAYIFRRTYPELEKLIDRARTIYGLIEPAVLWREAAKEFRFPSGAVVKMRHMEEIGDWRKYQGHEIHYAGWDELTQFYWEQYSKMKAWVRSSVPEIKARTRATSNPKGIGHGWVKARFVDLGAYRETAEVATDTRTGKEYRTRRIFIPATVYDNRYYRDDPAYMAHLLTMPEDDRRAFFEGNWDTPEGQFFSEWTPSVHIVEPFAIPKDWRRFGCLDYGFVSPLTFYKVAISPDGLLYVYHETYKARLEDEKQALLLAEECAGERLEYIVASPDIWFASGKHAGQPTAETYHRTWAKMNPSFRVSLRKADDDRIQGWRRLRTYLKVFGGADGQDVARLRVFATCRNLLRTLPMMQHDEKHPDDMYTDPHIEDHPCEALRYGVMSRPQAKAIEEKIAEDQAAHYMKKYLEKHKRRAYIGV